MKTSHPSIRNQPHHRRAASASLVLAAGLAFSLPAIAQTTRTWDGGPGGTGTEIGTAANWSGDTLPSVSAGDWAAWNGTVSGPLTLTHGTTSFAGSPGNPGINLFLAPGQTSPVTIDSGGNTSAIRMNSLGVSAGAGALTLGNNADTFNLTLGGAAGTRNWTNDSVNPVTINRDVVWGLGGGGAHTLALYGSGDWVFNNVMGQGTGLLSVNKLGLGTVILTNLNTYSNTTVSAGTLRLMTAGSLGHATSSLIINGGTVDLGGLSRSNGVVTLTSGTLTNGTLRATTLTADNPGPMTIWARLDGPAALTKSAAGTLTIANTVPNTYSGGTTIGVSAGAAVLRLTGTHALGTGAVTLDTTGNASTARLELAGGITLTNNVNFPGRNNSSVGFQNISGNNLLSGTLSLSAGGSIYLIQSDAGTLTLGTAGAPAVTVASGSRLLTLQGAANGTVAGYMTNGAGTLALTKEGAGTWTLAANNTFTGATLINAGTLALSAGGNLASPIISIASGAVFDVSAASFTLASGRSLTNGTGTVNGNLATASGSSIYPATDGVAGTLTFNNNLTLAAGGTIGFDLSTSSGSGNDQILVGGNLTLGSANTIRLRALAGAAPLDETGDYVLFNVSGASTMTTVPSLVWVGTPPANQLNFSLQKIGENIVLKYTSGSAPTVAASVTPSSATRNQAVTVTAVVTPGSGGIASVTANLTPIGGSPTAGLVLSNSFVYTNTFLVGPAITPGVKAIVVTVTDDTTPTPFTASDTANLTVTVANRTWDGGSTANDNWTSNENWVGDTAPGYVGDSVTFAGATRLTPNLDASHAVTSVTFDATAGSFTLGASGSTLTNSGGITNLSANPQTVNVPLVLTAPQALHAVAGDLAFGAAISQGAHTLTLSGNSNFTLAGPLTGTGSFDKTGTGSLSVSGDLLSGEVNFEKGVTTVSGKVEALGGGSRIRVGRNAGAGVLNVQPGGTAIANWSLVAGSDTSTGTINVNGGTLVHQGGLEIYLGSGGSGSTGILNLNSGTLSNRINGMIIGESGASVGVYNQSGGLGLLGTNIIVGQTVNTNQFNLSGGTATAVNLYVGRGNGTGTATLSGGTLNLSGVARVAEGVNPSSTATGLLTVSNTAVLNVENDLVLGFAGNGNLGRMVIEGGTVNVASTVTRWLILGQWDTARSQLDMNGGQLNLNASTALKFSVASTSATTNVVNLNGGAITFYSDNGVTVGGSGFVDLANAGAAAARNTFNLNGGVLTTPRVGATSLTPTRLFNFNGGTLRAAASSATFFQGLSTANVLAGGAVIDSDNKTITIAQNLLNGGGGGGLTKLGPGTLTLSGTNTYVGPTTVSNGTLLITGSIGTGAVSVASGATLGGTGTINGPVSVAAGGTFAPGTSIGTLTLANTLTLAGTTALEVNKSGMVLTSDLATGITTLNCGGTVTVTATGDALAVGDEFTVFNAGTFAGAFTGITPAPGAGLAWDTVKLATEGKLRVHANPVANNDVAEARHGQTITIAVAKLLGNDTGEPGETLAVTAVGPNASLGGGLVTYTAPLSGTSDTISYTLSDGRGGTATGTINVTLIPADAPSLNVVAGPTLSGGQFQVTFAGIPGYTYTVEDSTVSASGPWSFLTNLTAGPNGLFHLVVTNDPPAALRFFRTTYP